MTVFIPVWALIAFSAWVIAAYGVGLGALLSNDRNDANDYIAFIAAPMTVPVILAMHAYDCAITPVGRKVVGLALRIVAKAVMLKKGVK